MKKVIYLTVVMFVMISGLFAFAGGDGTSGNPYQVSNPVELDSVRHFLGSYFIQTADIDLNVSPWNTGLGWTPIGDGITAFTGSYDGDNFEISGLFIDRSTDLVGLFGYIVGGNIQDLNITSADVTGGIYVGSIGGYLFNNSFISNCHVAGSINGADEVGGITGYLDNTTMTGCTSTVTVNGGADSGGLSGSSEESQVINCSSNSDITTIGNYAGGLIGYNFSNSSVSLSDFSGTVTGDYYVGGIIGYNKNTTITECNANSDINATRYSSALIGRSESDSISNCYSSGTIVGDLCGGLVGEASSSIVIDCNADVTISANGYGFSGGLIGRCYSTEVSYCFSSGAINDDYVVGGLIGTVHTGSIISNSYSDADASCNIWSAGGLLGESYDSQVINCYSNGPVSGPDYIGGLIGYVESNTTTSSYWDTVTSGQTFSDGGSGRTTAQMKLQSTYSGWDYSTPIWKIVDTVTYPYLARQPNSTVTFAIDPVGAGTINGIDGDYLVGYGIDLLVQLNEDYDLVNWTDNTKEILSTDTAFTYIVTDINADITANCFFNPFAGGMGTELDPFQVSTPEELNEVRNFLAGYYFIQTADIDLGVSPWVDGNGWTPIGSNTGNMFTGYYEGDRHEITNLTINRPTTDFVGLFGCTSEGEVSNLTLTYVDVTGSNFTGGLVGYSYTNSTISGCASEGSITGAMYVGGLTGIAFSNASISNSYSRGSVTGDSDVGGFIGRQFASFISNSYTTSDVIRTSGSANTEVAGFIGENASNSEITKCYSTGSVTYTDATDPTDRGFAGNLGTSTVMSDNFWDTETSGQTTTIGIATGKTAAEMNNVSTYTDIRTVGLTTPWDFVNDPNDDIATNDYWNIHNSLNNGYPYLEWESRIPVEKPMNLNFTYSVGTLTITWDAVIGATDYKVYSSADPYGTFSLNETGSFNGEEWSTVTPGADKMFYYVVAINPTK